MEKIARFSGIATASSAGRASGAMENFNGPAPG
jgi:hypothetical protein